MENKFKDVLVLIPAFNEAENIDNTVQQLKTFFKNIVVINDGSTDKTKDRLSDLNINIINHCLNCGQGASLETGLIYFLRHTDFKYVITFDADGQHNKYDAKLMVDLIKSNKYSAVIGTRFSNKNQSTNIPLLKRITLKLAILYERIFYSINNTDAHNGLRVLSRKVVEKYLLPIDNHDMSHATEISKKLSNKDLNICEFPVNINYYNVRSQSIFNAINIAIKVIFYPLK